MPPHVLPYVEQLAVLAEQGRRVQTPGPVEDPLGRAEPVGETREELGVEPDRGASPPCVSSMAQRAVVRTLSSDALPHSPQDDVVYTFRSRVMSGSSTPGAVRTSTTL